MLAAKEAVLEYISSLGDKLDKQHPIREGVLREGCGLGCLPVMEVNNFFCSCRFLISVFCVKDS